jgi:hypothetical protein
MVLRNALAPLDGTGRAGSAVSVPPQDGHRPRPSVGSVP